VTLVAIGAFFPIYVALVSGIRGVDRKLVEVGAIFGLSRVRADHARARSRDAAATSRRRAHRADAGMAVPRRRGAAGQRRTGSAFCSPTVSKLRAPTRSSSRSCSSLRAENSPRAGCACSRSASSAGPTRCRSDVSPASSLRNGESGRAHPRPAQGVRYASGLRRTRPRRRARRTRRRARRERVRQVDPVALHRGLERSDAGTIATAGEIGVMFQEPRLFPWLDVARNVGFPARSDAERARVPNVLALVGLAHAAKQLPKELSGGNGAARVAGPCARARSASAAARRAVRRARCAAANRAANGGETRS